MPLDVTHRLQRRRIQAAWQRSDPIVAESVVAMEKLLGATGRADDVERLAPRHALINLMRPELELRPWKITRQHVTGADTFARVRTPTRGAICTFMHHGYYGGLFPSLARHGHTFQIGAAPQYMTLDEPGYWGLRDRAHIRVVTMLGNRIFPAHGSFDAMLAMLARGELVGLANDFAGRTPARFLGRDIRAASGLARLAVASGAPLVPVFSRPDGPTARLEVGEPLDPAGMSVEEVQAALFALHEPAVLAWPEAVELPLIRWAPEGPSLA